MKNLFATVFFLLFAVGVQAQSPSILGKWKTIDDNTGEAKSIVEIFERDGKVYGKIVKLFNKSDNELCLECKGDKKNKPIVGLEIIEGLTADGKVYEGGTILDPANGKEYDCKIWVEDGKLMVRGYIAFFFRTQTWLKAEAI
ncbi:DUF2147 domain-containing protein [Algivirga pacifica]|uniref:DUF2147 domain-containing protein n=1 Tax=Algivirga pacifica TaxID=1162670 RepID=A0ABP9DG99_9BACT